MKITLGPSPWPWSKATLRDFYNAAAELPIDTVVLGETVCPQRQTLSLDDWMALGDSLMAAGKEVRLATPTLVDSEAALALAQAVCSQARFPVEISDATALGLFGELPHSFAASAALTLYNAHSLYELVEYGLTHWNVPLELTRDDLSALLSSWKGSFFGKALPTVEITVYGYPLLSCSARCFTAQAHQRLRADCAQVCRLHPSGQLVHAMEDEPLFRLNGPQVLTGEPYNLLSHLAEIESLGITHVRILPVSDDCQLLSEMIAIIRHRPSQLPEALRGGTDGYWVGQAGMKHCDAF